MRNREIEKIKKIIVKVLKANGVKRAGIFGSYARGEQKKDSDVDILVEIPNKKLSLLFIIGLQLEIQKMLHKKIDIVEYDEIHPYLKKRILKEERRIL